MATYSDDPADIQEPGDGSLHIRWTDGHASIYSHPYLRAVCPCAVCNDLRRKAGQGGARLLPGPMRDDITVRDTAPVGRYALTFQFSDGHNTGIFPFKMLREVCPCEACSK